MKKYSWKASSNDGSFEDDGGWFETHEEAYNDMRNHALEKMKWNTEWEDFSDLSEEDFIAYDVQFTRNSIIHRSYSGIYTYEIVKKSEKVCVYDNTWTVEDEFTPIDGVDWKVAKFNGVGELWMNNCNGYMVLILPNGTILKSDI
jgi:hypothetical protein